MCKVTPDLFEFPSFGTFPPDFGWQKFELGTNLYKPFAYEVPLTVFYARLYIRISRFNKLA